MPCGPASPPEERPDGEGRGACSPKYCDRLPADDGEFQRWLPCRSSGAGGTNVIAGLDINLRLLVLNNLYGSVTLKVNPGSGLKSEYTGNVCP